MRELLDLRVPVRWFLASSLASAFGRGMTLPYMYAYLSQDREFDAWFVGAALGWMAAAAMVAMPYGGRLVDRFGARACMLPGYAVQAVSVASIGVAAHEVVLLASLTGVAAGAAVVAPGQTVLLAQHSDEDQRSTVFSVQFAVANLGLGLGAVGASAIVSTGSDHAYQWLFVVNAVVYVVPAGVLLRLRDLPGARVGSGQVDDGGDLEPLRDRVFRTLMLATFVLLLASMLQQEVGFNAFALEAAGVSPGVLGLVLAANTVAVVMFQLRVTRLVARFRRTRVAALAALVFAVSWLVLGLGALGEDASGAVVAAVLAAAVVFAVGEMLLAPSIPTLVNSIAGDSRRGAYNGVSSAVFNLAGILAPLVAAPLIGYGFAMLWLGLMVVGCVLGMAAFLRLGKRLSPATDRGRTTS